MQKPWEVDIQIYDDEPQLLAGLRRGDKIACTCLLKRFAPRLYRVALHLVGDAEEAEDVLQDSFIQACGHMSDFEGRSSLGSWLHRIVVNTALMRLRRKQPAHISLDEQLHEAERPVSMALTDTTTEPAHEVLGAELRMALEQALLTLPDTLRAAFVLREIEGLSTKDAAAALGIAEPALKVRLHRARLALRAALASYLATTAETQGEALYATTNSKNL